VNVRKFENGEHLQREAKRNDGNLESIHKWVFIISPCWHSCNTHHPHWCTQCAQSHWVEDYSWVLATSQMYGAMYHLWLEVKKLTKLHMATKPFQRSHQTKQNPLGMHSFLLWWNVKTPPTHKLHPHGNAQSTYHLKAPTKHYTTKRHKSQISQRKSHFLVCNVDVYKWNGSLCL
jgi:predicted Fe-S protein YdhL (DUF1289 family)